MITQPEVRFKAVETYIENGESLRRTSEKLRIPHITLWRWVNWYKEGGKKNLKRKKPYRRPWNRPSKAIEKKVMLLKEKNPALTLKKSQDILTKEGIKISLNGVWKIWKRYALTRTSKEDPYEPFVPLTPEIKDSLKRIKKLLKDGMVEEASKIANSLPSFPKDPVLKEIPEGLLAPRKQLDRLSFFFGEIPFAEYYKKVRKIRRTLEKKELYYSSIYAGLRELLTLSWMKTPVKELELITILEERTAGIKDPSLKFLLSMYKGMICADNLDGKKAKKHIRECIRLLRFLPYSFYISETANLLTCLTDYKKASYYYQKALKMERTDNEHKDICRRLAYMRVIGGRYGESTKSLRYARKDRVGDRTLSAVAEAGCAFGQGDISKASSYCKIALEDAKSGQIRNKLHAASLGLAVIQAALGKEKEAKIMLRKYLPLFRKYGMEQETLMRNILLRKNILINEQIHGFPVFHFLSLLRSNCKTSGYKKALKFAQNKGLFGLFHRMIVFFPEPVKELLEKGKPTGLPRAILNLPVFRKEIPVYSVNFLGHLVVRKNQEYLKVKLRPKDTSFLIYLASSREKSISLERIYRNFWPNSKNPSRNLAHFLVRIRKSLRLPSHFLYVKENRLFFDCYFTTDYGEYTEHLVQAKALLRAGEWGFAKREYLQAFKLFRGEPFRKMYDDWSDDKRLEILFSYETEVLPFIKELRVKGRKEEAKKLLKKAERIVPFPPNNYQP